MSFFQPQNPGIGGLDELTNAEEDFITSLAGLSLVQGDILYHDGTNLTRLAAGTSGHFLKTNGPSANPVWAAAGGGTGFNVETPTGTVNGSNVTFTVANTPKAVIIDGMTRFDGFGYSLAGLTITVDSLMPPSSYIRSFY